MEKKKVCSVVDCHSEAIRSLSLERVEHVGMKVGEGRRAYLCAIHYKEFKKKNKEEQKFKRWRWNAQ